jgi:hypothetical protein
MTDNREPTAAQVTALANRLLAQKAAPGWHDLKLIGQMMQEEAHAAVRNYRGKDGAELLELHLRAQIADLHIAEFFGRIEAAIALAQELPWFKEQQGKPQVITERIPGSY